MGKTSYRRANFGDDTSDEKLQSSGFRYAWELAALFFFMAGILLPLVAAHYNCALWTGLSEGARVVWTVSNVFLFAVCMRVVMAVP